MHGSSTPHRLIGNLFCLLVQRPCYSRISIEIVKAYNA